MGLTVDLTPDIEKRLNSLGRWSGVPAPFYVALSIANLLDLDRNSVLFPKRFRSENQGREDRFPILDAAVREMKENQLKWRDESIEAIARKNRLLAEVCRLERQIVQTKQEAAQALQAHNDELATEKLREKRAQEQKLRGKAEELAAAVEKAEAIKEALRHDEDRLRARIAERLALQANVKLAQIPLLGEFELVKLLAHLRFKPVEVVASSLLDAGGASGEKKTMSIALDLAAEAEALLQTEAEKRGLTASEYVAKIVEGLVNLADLVTPLEADTDTPPPDMMQVSFEEILHTSVREMKENQIKNRERIVKVITHKNMLQAEVDKLEHRIAYLERKSLEALQSQNRQLALGFYREMRLQERILEVYRSMLNRATETAETAKQELRQEEERVRISTAKTLLLKAKLFADISSIDLDLPTIEMDLAFPAITEAEFDRWAGDHLDAEMAVKTSDDSEDFIEATLRELQRRLDSQPDRKEPS